MLRQTNKYIYNFYLSKTKKIELLPVCMNGSWSTIYFQLRTQDKVKARRFEIIWRSIIFGIFSFAFGISTIDLFYAENNDYNNQNVQYISEFQNFGMDIA